MPPNWGMLAIGICEIVRSMFNVSCAAGVSVQPVWRADQRNCPMRPEACITRDRNALQTVHISQICMSSLRTLWLILIAALRMLSL